MSTPPRTEAVETIEEVDERKTVWHNAATWDDWVLAIQGKNYTAACGQRFKGGLGVTRHRSTLSPIERCVVCRERFP